jgi:hypothetical protein
MLGFGPAEFASPMSRFRYSQRQRAKKNRTFHTLELSNRGVLKRKIRILAVSGVVLLNGVLLSNAVASPERREKIKDEAKEVVAKTKEKAKEVAAETRVLAKQGAEKAKEVAEEVAEHAKDAAKRTAEVSKEIAAKTKEVAGEAADKIKEAVKDLKD